MYRGSQRVSFKRIFTVHNHSLKPSILTSKPSTWSIPRFSILSRTTDTGAINDEPQSRKKTVSKTVDLKANEVVPEANDSSFFVSGSNSSKPSQQHQCRGSHRRSQNQGGYCRRSKHKWRQHNSFRRRITEVPPIPEQTEDEKDIEDCVVITNTIDRSTNNR